VGARRTTEFVVGIFGIVASALIAYVAVRLGTSEILQPPGYLIYAGFDNIAGLRTGDQVDIAGVPVGQVARISLKDNRAQVAMRIEEGVKIDNEATAAIQAVGIIGGQCVSIAPDSGNHYLRDRERLHKTRSAFVLEDVIGRLITKSQGGSAAAGKTK
jgi:phospholipid/cholesterol/gamma-HCH transport system substrate-binding protein